VKSRKVLLFIFFLVVGVVSHAEQITVACASNFSGAMKEIVAVFEQQSGHQVNLVFGSSGRIYAQIKNGAPFDIFFSADQQKPMALATEGLIVSHSRFTYALGALVLWSSNPAVNVEQAEVVRQHNYTKLAIANPKLAPYGRAAVEALDSLGLSDASRNKWIQGENIAQTFQFVSTGNAEIGFVALSQVTVDGEIKNGSGWIVPSSLYSPIKQDVVLLRKAEQSEAARALLDFVQGQQGQRIVEAFGYQHSSIEIIDVPYGP